MNPVYVTNNVRRLDPSVLESSLSLYRQPSICILFSSRLTSYNNKRVWGTLDLSIINNLLNFIFLSFISWSQNRNTDTVSFPLSISRFLRSNKQQKNWRFYQYHCASLPTPLRRNTRSLRPRPDTPLLTPLRHVTLITTWVWVFPLHLEVPPPPWWCPFWTLGRD